MKLIIEKEVKKIPKNFTGIVEDNGNKFWYRNGKCHRKSGPAKEYANGDKYWYRNGELHREDGPAVEWANGAKYWYLNGIQYTESEYKAKLYKSKSKSNKKIVTIKGKRYKLVPV